ncbi:hypothetical protein ACFFKU_12780 [Kineococcus gynurae]|uniref:Uncharacterized protein n=1 Tax=Kineococcus gynurae TaxID=452979 RepID=A0ABV5LQK2_9ACTN
MADVAPAILVNSVLGKIQDVLLNGDGDVVPRSDDHYLAVLNVGIPMDPADFDYAREGFSGVYRRNVDEQDLVASTGPQPAAAAPAEEGPSVEQQLAADALRKYMSAENFATLVDLVPDTSGIIDNGRITVWNPEARVSRVYATALQHSQVYDNEPDAETAAKVDRWRSKLVTTRKEKDVVTEEEVEVTEDAPLVKAYNEKMTAYLGAAMEYNNTRIAALGGQDQEAVHRMAVNGPLMQLRLRQAMADWSGAGHKGDYERLTAAIQSVEERAFVLLKQRYKEDFLRSMLTNPSTNTNFPWSAPASSAFASSDSGWTEFYFNSSSFESNHTFRSRSTKAGGGFSVGAFTVGGGGQVTHQEFDRTFESTRFSMSCKLARVPISRPWLALDYLLSSFWRFDANNAVLAGRMVSDGRRPPEGLMPAITTDCIFVKDLSLDFGEGNSALRSEFDKASGGGGFSFGPFSFGARHTATESSWHREGSHQDQGVKIDGLQLLGFMCYMLPQSPNPDPAITAWV